ncbi:hypothetical protein [Brevibacterium pityocampae]|uniref:Uncharacterized protein n=1 Tax=Brevibacterium pityocampae TaxID=506594 RepID=A0ABP8JK95_9MICO
MTTLYLASGIYDLVCLTELLRNGSALPPDDEKVLVAYDSTYAPELNVPLQDSPFAQSMLTHFDAVVDWNAVCWPSHPAHFNVDDENRAAQLRGLIERAWQLDGSPTALVLNSFSDRPAQTIARIWSSSQLTVYMNGPEVYGPLTAENRSLSRPVQACITWDLVPRLEPRTPRGGSPAWQVRSIDSIGTVIDEAVRKNPDADVVPALRPGRRRALIERADLIGMKLATESEERALLDRMLAYAADAGADEVILCDPPSSTGPATTMHSRAEERGLDLFVASPSVPLSFLNRIAEPEITICMTGRGLAEARSAGARRIDAPEAGKLLSGLTQMNDAHRVPLTVLDILYGPSTDPGRPGIERSGASEILDAVVYAMSPQDRRALRTAATAAADAADDDILTRYFTPEARDLLSSASSPRPPTDAGLDRPSENSVAQRAERSPLASIGRRLFGRRQ